jgi:hypothetical protein
MSAFCTDILFEFNPNNIEVYLNYFITRYY